MRAIVLWAFDVIPIPLTGYRLDTIFYSKRFQGTGILHRFDGIFGCPGVFPSLWMELVEE
jgi:hypothetical protein